MVEGCELYLEAAGALVFEIPKTREEVLSRIASAKKLKDDAREEMWRVRRDESSSRAEVREAERAFDEAHWRHFGTQQELGSDHLDPENRKAVVRQLAGLIREDTEKRLGRAGPPLCFRVAGVGPQTAPASSAVPDPP